MQIASQFGLPDEKNLTAEKWPKYLMDITENERIAGFSKELAKTTFEIKDTKFSILDAPGNL